MDDDEDVIADMVEFEEAMETYSRRNGRPFPTFTEAYQVLLSLGYRQLNEDGSPKEPPPPPAEPVKPVRRRTIKYPDWQKEKQRRESRQV